MSYYDSSVVKDKVVKLVNSTKVDFTNYLTEANSFVFVYPTELPNDIDVYYNMLAELRAWRNRMSVIIGTAASRGIVVSKLLRNLTNIRQVEVEEELVEGSLRRINQGFAYQERFAEANLHNLPLRKLTADLEDLDDYIKSCLKILNDKRRDLYDAYNEAQGIYSLIMLQWSTSE